MGSRHRCGSRGGRRPIGACARGLLPRGGVPSRPAGRRADPRRSERTRASGRSASSLDSVGQPRAPAGARGAFSAGLMSDLLNPKIGLFYVAVIRRFVPPGVPALQYSMLLCAVDIGVAVTWLAALTWLAHGAVKRRLGAPS